MSETPRTDTEAIGFARILIDRRRHEVTEIIPSNFARQLERELNLANAKIAKYRELVRQMAQMLHHEFDEEIRIAEIEST